MATIKGKPPGYFEILLAMDCETSGLNFNAVDPSEGYQSIAWGFVVADAHTLKPIEKLYLEIKWDGKSTWSPQAEKVHGLSKEHLKENGVTSEEAAIIIGNLILKYWGPTVSIRTLGHNVATFDLWFLRRLMEENGITLNFGNRHVDTSSIGFVNWEVFTSDQLFDAVGLEERGVHNALDDALMALEAARRTRVLFQSLL